MQMLYMPVCVANSSLRNFLELFFNIFDQKLVEFAVVEPWIQRVDYARFNTVPEILSLSDKISKRSR